MNQKKLRRHRRQLTLPDIGVGVLWTFIIFFAVYCLKSPAYAQGSVKRALETCAVSLIPSLFPFTAAIGIMNSSGLSAHISRLFGSITEKIFGVSQSSACAILLGAVGGFPIGAMCVRDLYSKGAVSKEESERLLCFTCNAGPAFCIGAVGGATFGDTVFGIKLYLCQLTSAFIIGILQRKKAVPRLGFSVSDKRRDLFGLICSSIQESGLAMLKICSFAVFFAVVGDAVYTVILKATGHTAAILSSSLFELTFAVSRASELPGKVAYLAAALAVGWSGLSVHMQTASILSGSGIGMKRYYISKAAQGLLTALLVFFIV